MRTAIAALLMLGSLMGATLPRKMGEFGFELPNGKQALLSQYKGKAILLSFFSSTCPHCQTASKFIEKLNKEYAPQGFQPIGVCFDPMAKMLVPEFISKQGLTYPVGAATNDQVLEYVQHPQGMIPYVPMFLLIDKQGMIRAQFQPGINDDFYKNLDANLRAEVEKIVKGTPSKAAPAKSTATKTAPAVTAAK
jgi:peroxiredoxin